MFTFLGTAKATIHFFGASRTASSHQTKAEAPSGRTDWLECSAGRPHEGGCLAPRAASLAFMHPETAVFG